MPASAKLTLTILYIHTSDSSQYLIYGGIMKYMITILFLLSIILMLADGGGKSEGNTGISPEKYKLTDENLLEKEPLPEDESQITDNADYIVWESEVHHVDHNFYIRNGEILKIMPGTQVIITGNFIITVEAGGMIRANGTIEKPITFAVDYDNDFNFGESNRGTSLEYWQGFKFLAGGNKEDLSNFTWCNFPRILADSGAGKGSSEPHNQKLFTVEGDCSLLFNNCRFTDNNYLEEDFFYIKYSDIEFRNCIFKNNNTGLRLENSFLKLNNTTIADNEYFDLNLYRVDSIINDCAFIDNQNFNLLIRQKQTLTIRNSNFTNNSNPQKPLIAVEDLKKATLENTHFRGNTSLAIQCNDTELVLTRCLITRQTQNSALYFDSKTGRKVTSLINCNITDNQSPENICQIGSNIILILINSVFMDNSVPEFNLINPSQNSAFYAFNSVISQTHSVVNDHTRMKTQWNSIIDPENISDVHDYRLIDQGWQKYSSGDEVIFEYSPSQYIGTAPDIGYYEE